MGGARTRAASVEHVTLALVVGRVATGDADVIVTLFTEKLGRVSALARNAMRSQRRFGGALEPLHTVRVQLSERVGSELMHLRDAKLETARTGLLTDLRLMDAAGRALGYLRRAAPVHVPEPKAWQHTVSLLDLLESRSAPSPDAALAAYGMALLEIIGWGLELTACVGCGTVCPAGKTALIDPARGGIVCRACGGGSHRISAALRAALCRARDGQLEAISDPDAGRSIALVEETLSAHAG
ncbi:MAG TPA: DNA repair protein RecO [Polyangiaceae bacterium]|nr:DNA repair protein RecO [Polyangiaceae bacterium]